MKPDCRSVSELIAAHADGGLDEPTARRVDLHVAGCPDCAAELRASRQLLVELRGIPAGPARDEASWGDFSRSVRLAWQESREELEERSVRARARRWGRLVFGGGLALALGTALFIVVETRTRDEGGGALAGAKVPPVLPASPSAADADPVPPQPLDEQGQRLEEAGRLGDLLGDPDPDELLDELSDEQLEQVGKALTPGA